MKRLLTIGFIMVLTLGVKAQTSDDIAFFQSIWGMEKRTIVKSYMDLSEADAAKFWTVYEAYELTRKDLGKQRVAILGDYAKNYGSLSGEKAKELINKAVANNIAMQKLFKKTFKNMSKVLDPVTAAKFIQLENYFMLMIQMNIQESIPFVDEI
jgi:hypothetical protein